MIFGEPGQEFAVQGLLACVLDEVKAALAVPDKPFFSSEGEAVSIFFNSLSWSPASFVCAATRLIAK